MAKTKWTERKDKRCIMVDKTQHRKSKNPT